MRKYFFQKLKNRAWVINKNLILGTANFGQVYGINKKRKVKINEIRKIINFAKKNKIKFFDTSRSYGNSEKILVDILKDISLKYSS